MRIALKYAGVVMFVFILSADLFAWVPLFVPQEVFSVAVLVAAIACAQAFVWRPAQKKRAASRN